MLILALNGSPHKNGNTAGLLRAALNAAAEQGADTKFIQIPEVMASVKQVFCLQCSSPCKGVCYKGTLLEEALDLLRRADGVIMGSPVYFQTVSAQLKAFWDKTRMLRKELALVNVVGGAVAVGASRFGGQEMTVRTLHDLMLVQGMTVVADGYYADGDAGHFGACAQVPADEDAQALKRVQVLARRVCQVADATRELRAVHRVG